MSTICTKINPNALAGKTALITGGASGIGLSTAQAWVDAGAHVVIIDIQPVDKGTEIAAELGPNASYVWCDISSWDSQVSAFKTAIANSPSGSLDVVAAFAGVLGVPGSMVDHVMAASPDRDLEEPRLACIRVNLIGTYYTSQLALQYLGQKISSEQPEKKPDPPSPDKSLILVGSIASFVEMPRASDYSASKFGVRGLFRSLQKRALADLGVRCNLIAPWFADTPLVAPIKKSMAAGGVDIAKALTFVPVQDCVDAATMCAIDRGLNGRAFSVQPEGTYDLGDSLEEGFGADKLRLIVQKRRDEGYLG